MISNNNLSLNLCIIPTICCMVIISDIEVSGRSKRRLLEDSE